VVATPAVEVKGAGVGAWICDAVVVPVSPEKETCTVIVTLSTSTVTTAVPVPGEALGGDSFGPLNVAENTCPREKHTNKQRRASISLEISL
jgi:hypothetical protein